MSQRALPEHFLRQEFPFEFAKLGPALEDLLAPPAAAAR
jgi:NAD dependent epimerase/dehydratase family enzyme